MSNQTDVDTAKELWRDFFDTALYVLTDYEMSDETLSRVPKRAAIVADAALAVFEERWPL